MRLPGNWEGFKQRIRNRFLMVKPQQTKEARRKKSGKFHLVLGNIKKLFTFAPRLNGTEFISRSEKRNDEKRIVLKRLKLADNERHFGKRGSQEGKAKKI